MTNGYLNDLKIGCASLVVLAAITVPITVYMCGPNVFDGILWEEPFQDEIKFGVIEVDGVKDTLRRGFKKDVNGLEITLLSGGEYTAIFAFDCSSEIRYGDFYVNTITLGKTEKICDKYDVSVIDIEMLSDYIP